MKVDMDLEVDSPVALGKLELFLRALPFSPRMRQYFLRDGELVDSSMECHGSLRVRQAGHMAVATGGVFSRRSSSHR